MQHTNLGELTVSAQGPGCMGFERALRNLGLGSWVATIRRAIDLGVPRANFGCSDPPEPARSRG
jgi:hypothetical protein